MCKGIKQTIVGMTDKGETMTLKGENKPGKLQPSNVWKYSLQNINPQKDAIWEKKDQWNESALKGAIQEYLVGGIHIWYGLISMTKNKTVLIDYNEPVVQMCFSIKSSSEYKVDKQSPPFVSLENFQHNIIGIPDARLNVEWGANSSQETFVISLLPEVFLQYLPKTHRFSKNLKQNLAEGKVSYLSESPLPITPKITAILYEILNCELKGYFKKIYMEAKIVELLALQLGQSEEPETASYALGLKREDMTKMYQVRELLLSDLTRNFSLKELAHEVGTNENSLKNNFKKVFGNTVFGYLHDYKMERSKKMLVSGKTLISEISESVGYKHATHFTAAFKKYFGFLPTKINSFLLNFLYLTQEFIPELIFLETAV